MNPALVNSPTASRMLSTSGPHGMEPATSSGRTNWVAPANPEVPGSSAFTFQPPPNQRNWLCARSTALLRSVSQQIGSCPILRDARPPTASSHVRTSSASGSTAIRSPSASAGMTQWCGVRICGRM